MNASRERDEAFTALEPVDAAVEHDGSIVDRQLRSIVRGGREAIDAGAMHDEISGPLDGESLKELCRALGEHCGRHFRVDHLKDRRTAPTLVREVPRAETERRDEQPRQQIAGNSGKRHGGPQRGALLRSLAS